MTIDNETVIDLLALFAEVEADQATPEGQARIAAAEAAEVLRMTPRAERHDCCGKCRGTGHLPEYRHISGGDCFDCHGSGLVGGHL